MRANGKPHAPPAETGLKTASPSKARFFIPSHRPVSCHQMQRLLQVAISPLLRRISITRKGAPIDKMHPPSSC
jgi:hypothetical protein